MDGIHPQTDRDLFIFRARGHCCCWVREDMLFVSRLGKPSPFCLLTAEEWERKCRVRVYCTVSA